MCLCSWRKSGREESAPATFHCEFLASVRLGGGEASVATSCAVQGRTALPAGSPAIAAFVDRYCQAAGTVFSDGRHVSAWLVLEYLAIAACDEEYKDYEVGAARRGMWGNARTFDPGDGGGDALSRPTIPIL